MKIKIERKVERVIPDKIFAALFGKRHDRHMVYLSIKFTEEERTVLRQTTKYNDIFWVRPYDYDTHRSVPTGEYWDDQYHAKIQYWHLLDAHENNFPVEIARCTNALLADQQEANLRAALVKLKKRIENSTHTEQERDYEL